LKQWVKQCVPAARSRERDIPACAGMALSPGDPNWWACRISRLTAALFAMRLRVGRLLSRFPR
jgi:hypothetical protein